MKLSEYKEKLKADREYQDALNELEYQFLFGNAVLRARLNKGWTQKELAKRVGTKQANISRIEGGLANPTLELIQKVSKALDLRISFTGKADKKGEWEVLTETDSSIDDYVAGVPIPAPDLFYTYTSSPTTTTGKIAETKPKWPQ